MDKGEGGDLATVAHADDLITRSVLGVSGKKRLRLERRSNIHMCGRTDAQPSRLPEKPKQRRVVATCGVSSSDSLNRPPKQSKLDFRELNVLDFNQNKLSKKKNQIKSLVSVLADLLSYPKTHC